MSRRRGQTVRGVLLFVMAALWIGASVVLAGAVAAFAIGKRRVSARAEVVQAEPLAEAA
jgi:hypothetical protein